MHYSKLIRTTLSLIGLLASLPSNLVQAHGPDWEPDYVLEATATNITINCHSRYSVIVNGTSPGPTVYLKEGQTTWVRVWNRISDQNFTLVSIQSHSSKYLLRKSSTGMVLAKEQHLSPMEHHSSVNGLSHQINSSIMKLLPVLVMLGRTSTTRMLACRPLQHMEL